MNRILSGTGWGEKADIDADIQIAPWLTREWKELDRDIKIATEYYEERGRARGRRESRRKQNYRADQWQGLAVVLMIFFVLALVENCF